MKAEDLVVKLIFLVIEMIKAIFRGLSVSIISSAVLLTALTAKADDESGPTDIGPSARSVLYAGLVSTSTAVEALERHKEFCGARAVTLTNQDIPAMQEPFELSTIRFSGNVCNCEVSRKRRHPELAGCDNHRGHIIFLPGFGLDNTILSQYAIELANRGFLVDVIDIPLSEADESEVAEIWQLQESIVISVVQRLFRGVRSGGQDILIGYSFGGYLARRISLCIIPSKLIAIDPVNAAELKESQFRELFIDQEIKDLSDSQINVAMRELADIRERGAPSCARNPGTSKSDRELLIVGEWQSRSPAFWANAGTDVQVVESSHAGILFNARDRIVNMIDEWL